ncbi:type I polyketide synthase, partial [Nocardia sp. NPDC004604]|uniref:type I polyketide synthase n=1 Tax=Nocardia sp. NPDC004604 TaxID=3157013 RepID=UPI0033AE6091
PNQNRPRRAAVSGFGISGTNAHLILEQPPIDAQRPPRRELPCVPLVLSGPDEATVRAQAARLADPLGDEVSALDIGYTLATGRAVFDHRAVIIATDDPALRTQALRTLARGGTHPDVIIGQASGSGVAMVFSGQGSQRHGMGRELYDTYPVYAEAFDTACAEIDRNLPQPLRDIIFGDDTALIDRTQYTQPALFAMQVALYRLWESWGVTPTVVTGHSIGEITAAHIAGVLTLTDAATLVATRGRLMQSLPEGGAMAAVDITEHDVLPHLRGREDTVGIAAINGPNSLVLSGDRAALRAVTEKLAGHRITWLKVSHAFHSPLTDPMLDQFREVLEGLSFAAPTIPLISSVTGAPVDDTTRIDPDHWIRHARNTVRLTDTLEHITDKTCLEVGPTASLLQHLPSGAVPSLRTDRSEPRSLTAALAHLVASGVNPHWRNYFDGAGARTTTLPTYPFQRKHYWLDHRVAGPADLGAAGVDRTGHALLTAVIADPQSGALICCGRIGLDSHPWLADHAVGDRVVLPGTAYVDLVLHAGTVCGRTELDDLTLEAPMVLPLDGALDVRLTVEPADPEGRSIIRIHSRAADFDPTWTRHATAVLATPNSLSAQEDTLVWPPAGAQPLDLDSLYDDLADRGLRYGPVFRGLRAAWARQDEVFAEVALPEHIEGTGHVVHPALLDAALHAIGLGDLLDTHDPAPLLPFAFRGVRVTETGATALRVRLTAAGPDTVALRLSDTDGRGVGSVAALTLRRTPVDHEPAAAPRSLLHIRWQELPTAPAPAASWWVVLGDDEPGLTSALQDSGIQVEKYADLADLGAAAAASSTVPDTVFLTPTTPDGVDVPTAAARLTAGVLTFLQTWLADRRF